jgi:TolB-like protein/tetratricopeptide (TPR) repeat protein
MSGIWGELKRRNVLRVGAAFVVFAWLALQVLSVVGPILDLPAWLPRAVLVLLALGFVLAVALAWIYELTPEGLQRTAEVPHHESITSETGRRLDRLTIAGIVVAIAVVAADRFWPQLEAPAGVATTTEPIKPGEPATTAPAPVAAASAKSIAVLPFVPLSRGEDDAYFADGLTEEILNSLSQLPELLVTARTSAFHFKGKDVPIPQIAATLGVAHVLEGSIRRSGDRLRITAQLIRAADGFHLWSEVYERGQEDVFVVQDDIAERVATALDVLLDEDARRTMQSVGVRDVEAYVAYQRGMVLYNEAHADSTRRFSILLRANAEFDRAIERAPGFFGAYLERTDLFGHVLLDPPFESTQEAIPPQLVDGAKERLAGSLQLALARARTPAERDSVDLTRIYLSDDWTGLSAALLRLVAHDLCVENLYGDRAALFGLAARAHAFYERQAACDPYDNGAQFPLVQDLLWQREFERADRAADRAIELLGESLFVSHLKLLVLVGRRDFAAARAHLDQALARHPAATADVRSGLHAMLLAAEGRREEALAAAQAWRATGDRVAVTRLPVEAWTGNREAANAVAAQMDAFPLSPAALMVLVRMCVCGAPWDLEATPNFARQIAQSGLAWPPPQVLDLPMKDW